MTEKQGAFTIPTRLYLSPVHRAQLERLIHERESDLAEVVSQIVGEYLDTLPAPPPASEPADERSAELHKRRSELMRLRAQKQAAGRQAPAWLSAYIAELEADIRRLEQ